MPNHYGWGIFCRFHSCTRRASPIWLPTPNPIQNIQHPKESPTVTERAMFLCPGCGDLFDYKADDVKHEVFAVPDRYLPQSEPRLVCLDFPCDDKSCGILVRIRAIEEPGETRQAFLAKARKAIASVRCVRHQTVMPDTLSAPPYTGSACQILW
jgi:hypothetical protein